MSFTMIILINTVDSLDSLISSQSTKHILPGRACESLVCVLGSHTFPLERKVTALYTKWRAQVEKSACYASARQKMKFLLVQNISWLSMTIKGPK